jgi:hypothetical protein
VGVLGDLDGYKTADHLVEPSADYHQKRVFISNVSCLSERLLVSGISPENKMHLLLLETVSRQEVSQLGQEAFIAAERLSVELQA